MPLTGSPPAPNEVALCGLCLAPTSALRVQHNYSYHEFILCKLDTKWNGAGLSVVPHLLLIGSLGLC